MTAFNWKRRAMAAVLLLVLLISSACQAGNTPTATPLPAGAVDWAAPRLLARFPALGVDQPLSDPVVLTFDQPMDQASVEAALKIEPAVPGKLSWINERTLSFAPDQPLKRGQQYAVTVGTGATSAHGKALAERAAFQFDTVGKLAVVQVSPTDVTTEAGPDTAITVVFNQPVVPLMPAESQGKLPNPLTIEPAVEGEGRWVNTAIYVFTPKEGFQPATEYKVRITGKLMDTTGGLLGEDYVWSFKTLFPAVQSVWPASGSQYLGLQPGFTVEFNQPMDHASTEAAFALTVEGIPVAGTFEWQSGEGMYAPEMLTFTPTAALPRSKKIDLVIDLTARARYGTVGLGTEFRATYETVKPAAFLSSDPADDAEKVIPVHSQIVMNFASPMDTGVFTQHLKITPAVTLTSVYWGNEAAMANLFYELEPQTAYQITLDATTPDREGMALGKGVTVSFKTGDYPPEFNLLDDWNLKLADAYTPTVAYIKAINISKVNVELYRISPDNFVRWMGDSQSIGYYNPTPAELVRKWTEAVSLPRNEYKTLAVPLLDEKGQELAPGIYYVTMQAPEQIDVTFSRFMFIKSRLNLTIKHSGTEVVVWATDLATGAPVAGLPLSLNGAMWQKVFSTTDKDGLGRWTDKELANRSSPLVVLAGNPGEANFAAATTQWSSGYYWYEQSNVAMTQYRSTIYTDLPIYRPGQTVYFKGIVRVDEDATYKLPTGLSTVLMQVNDPQGLVVYSETLELNDMGSGGGDFALNPEAALGDYSIVWMIDANHYLGGVNFQVAEYRKPEYQIAVTTDRPAYIAGETIAVSSMSAYYFGGPVQDAKATWNVLSSDYWFNYICPEGQSCPWYDWTDNADYWSSWYGGDLSSGEPIAQGEGVTDKNGQFIFKVPAELGEATTSREFSLEVTLTDSNNQPVSQRTTAIVHKGDFYVGLAAQGSLSQVGKEKKVDLLVVDAPLTADGESAPRVGQSLQVIFMEHRWHYTWADWDRGGPSWSSEDIPVYTTTVTTGADGKAVAAFTPEKAGEYRVRAQGLDSKERTISSSTYFWVWGGSRMAYWREMDNNQLNLIADKKEYNVGDTATVLVPSPFTGTVRALVTIERKQVMDAEVRTIDGNSLALQIPITEDYLPNVYVSVVLIQGGKDAADKLPAFRTGQIELPVSTAPKQLIITLTPDKATGEHYGPRQEATYELRATDVTGKPVQADFSLRLADLATLALADENDAALIDVFWGPRGLDVGTEVALSMLLKPAVVEPNRLRNGLGRLAGYAEEESFAYDAAATGTPAPAVAYSMAKGAAPAPALVRTNFADTAYWNASVRTDAEGKAKVTLMLPDNLTTWRMQAKGITAEALVGRSDVDIVSTLDLLLRPALPRFFVVGDQATLATTVHNNTDQEQTVVVKFMSEGLALQGPDQQTVKVAAHDKAQVRWAVTAQSVGEVRIQMSVQAEGNAALADAREDRLPIYRYSTPETVATAGRLSEAGTRMEMVYLPEKYDPEQGELTVRFDGSLTAAAQEGLAYLKHYPYECTEQTVSRFLPNVVTYQVLKKLGRSDPELETNLQAQVETALLRLVNNQRYDGGWGWWKEDTESSPYLTAYVLQGLLEAKRAGFTVNENTIMQGVSYLTNNMKAPGQIELNWEANRLAYQLYVLSEYQDSVVSMGANVETTAGALFDQRHKLDLYGKAYLARALALLKTEQSESQIQTLLADLTSQAVMSASGTHWEEGSPDSWNMNTNIRSTAIALWSFSHLEPKSELLPNAVRWLMTMRENGVWESTQDTAWSLMALAAYMDASGELEGDFTYGTALNGKTVYEGQFNAENLATSQVLTVTVKELLAGQGNQLAIERRGDKGQLYYAATLHTYLAVEEVKALNRGIIVAREYSLVSAPDQPITSAQVGDVIQVKLTIVAPHDLYYVALEDPLPAGCEAVDTSLKTTSQLAQSPEMMNPEMDYEYPSGKIAYRNDWGWSRRWGWGWWYFSHTELRDEKTAMFANYLPQGSYVYSYQIRAATPGVFRVMPTTAAEMYFPDIFGRSDGTLFTVVEAGE